LLLGYGVNAFFDVQKLLGFMCLAITFFLMPTYLHYSNNNQAGTFELDVPFKYALNRFTLGNLAGSTTECKVKKLDYIGSSQALDLTCPNGQRAVLWTKKI